MRLEAASMKMYLLSLGCKAVVCQSSIFPRPNYGKLESPGLGDWSIIWRPRTGLESEALRRAVRKFYIQGVELCRAVSTGGAPLKA